MLCACELMPCHVVLLILASMVDLAKVKMSTRKENGRIPFDPSSLSHPNPILSIRAGAALRFASLYCDCP